MERPDVSDLAREIARFIVQIHELTDPKDVQRLLRHPDLEDEVQRYVAWLARPKY